MVELRQADEGVTENVSAKRDKQLSKLRKMLRTLFLLVIMCSAYYTQKVAQCLKEDLMGNNDSHNHGFSKRYLAINLTKDEAKASF